MSQMRQEKLRDALRAVYKEFVPEKSAAEVGAILERFKGREAGLLKKVREKYADKRRGRQHDGERGGQEACRGAPKEVVENCILYHNIYIIFTVFIYITTKYCDPRPAAQRWTARIWPRPLTSRNR